MNADQSSNSVGVVWGSNPLAQERTRGVSRRLMPRGIDR
jgi:hypothetical protein